jgi:hypothetical protein
VLTRISFACQIYTSTQVPVKRKSSSRPATNANVGSSSFAPPVVDSDSSGAASTAPGHDDDAHINAVDEADSASSPTPSRSDDGGRPPWLHGVSLGKDEDRALLQDPATGEYPDGWFFVAELGQDSSNYPGHVLNINFRGKATRHLVKTDEATGFLLVNKKSYVTRFYFEFGSTLLECGGVVVARSLCPFSVPFL